MIELDVRKCASGDLVCIHNSTLKRLTGKKGFVKNNTLEELKELSIDGEKIPTLYEALDLINGKVITNIHLKEVLSDEIYAIIKKYLHKGLNYNNFIISSFSRKDLERIYSLDKNILLGYICMYPRIPRKMKKSGIKIYSIHSYMRLLKKRHIQKMQEKGFKVFAWTVNKKKHIEKFSKWSIDGIISDYPERI
jgi:glycerophosphoryl diester phosphodiesterase